MTPKLAQEIVDLFNDIFQIQLGWDFSTALSVSDDDARELEQLARSLRLALDNDQFRSAINVLRPITNIIRVANESPERMGSLNFTTDERAMINSHVENYHGRYLQQALDTRGLFQEEYLVVLGDDVEQFIDLFLPEEDRLLRRGGYDQSAVAIIMARIMERRGQIKKNLLKRQSISTKRVDRAASEMVRASERLASSPNAEEHPVSRAQIRDLRVAKDKVIGLATLFGNALPLLIAQDWGIASFGSAVAGATIAAVLPAGERSSHES